MSINLKINMLATEVRSASQIVKNQDKEVHQSLGHGYVRTEYKILQGIFGKVLSKSCILYITAI